MIEKLPLLILTNIILSVNIGNNGLYWLYLIISVKKKLYKKFTIRSQSLYNKYLL